MRGDGREGEGWGGGGEEMGYMAAVGLIPRHTHPALVGPSCYVNVCGGRSGARDSIFV